VVLRFGPFGLGLSSRTLHRGGSEIHLSPKAFDLLALLVRRRPAALSKAEIHQHLWPDTFVSDGNVAVLVAEIRSALGDSGRQSKFVRTVQRFGYAFAAVAAEEHDSYGRPRDPSRCWLVWGTQRVPLAVGQNVLGRDLTVDVLIDAVGVSRRHAMIVVEGDDATLVDLSSKNGTFANGVRVGEPVPLADDTEIRLGPVPVRFCTLAQGASTQTWNTARSSKVQ
jgi:DNA-binding winged helix-turn-helix (wHTH) protein